MKTNILIFSILLLLICCSDNSHRTKIKQNNNNEEIKSSNGLSAQEVELPEVFDNYDQEIRFKELVGADFKLFLTAFNTISEDEDLDAINAKVYSGMVPGLGTIKECIVIITSNGFMAAAIDGDTIKYFSSNRDYKTIIPNTIKSWINEKGEKSVKFMQ